MVLVCIFFLWKKTYTLAINEGLCEGPSLMRTCWLWTAQKGCNEGDTKKSPQFSQNGIFENEEGRAMTFQLEGRK